MKPQKYDPRNLMDQARRYAALMISDSITGSVDPALFNQKGPHRIAIVRRHLDRVPLRHPADNLAACILGEMFNTGVIDLPDDYEQAQLFVSTVHKYVTPLVAAAQTVAIALTRIQSQDPAK